MIRWALLLTVAWTFACSADTPEQQGCVLSSDCPPAHFCNAGRCVDPNAGDDPDGTRDAGTTPCVPKTCGELGAECDVVRDGCGGSLDCGKCADPDTCGGGGEANRCGCTALTCESPGVCGTVPDGCGGTLDCPPCPEGECVPSNCETLGAECSQIGDGCGETIECGSCATGRYCDANQCQCDPKDCETLGAECGPIDDGCGQLIDCGGCDAPYTCGGGDVPNFCGCQMVTRNEVRILQTAKSVDSVSGSLSWKDLGAATRIDGDGTDFTARGSCRKIEQEMGGCRCCAETTTVTRTTDDLFLTNAGLQIPPNATISRIRVEAVLKEDNVDPVVSQLRLVGPQGESSNFTDKDLKITKSYKRHVFEAPLDMEGSPLTPADVNSKAFGVRLRMTSTIVCSARASNCPISEGFVDGVEIRVYYDECE